MKVLGIINSRRDVSGNRYWAFTYTTEDNIEITGNASGGRSNIESAMRHLLGSWEVVEKEVVIISKELPIRVFNNITKNYLYAGCAPEKIAEFIKNTEKDVRNS